MIPLFHKVALIKVTSDLHTLESDSQLSAFILLDLRAIAGPVDHSLLETLSSPDFQTHRLASLPSKITADGDCSLEIRRRLFLGRKAMTNLDSVKTQRSI